MVAPDDRSLRSRLGKGLILCNTDSEPRPQGAISTSFSAAHSGSVFVVGGGGVQGPIFALGGRRRLFVCYCCGGATAGPPLALGFTGLRSSFRMAAA